MQIAWHGCTAVSLRIDGIEFLIDPMFSRVGDYGDWYTPNLNAPSLEGYLNHHHPDYLIITHGHFDHFDLETVKKILAARDPAVIGSPEVAEALSYYMIARRESVLIFRPGESKPLRTADGHVTVTTYEGEHWLTGEEGSRAALKLSGRPERYGVMPCGGPMLAFIIDSNEGRILVSGDNTVAGLPRERVDVAILSVGGAMLHPETKVKTWPVITPEQLPAALEILKPRLLIPVHWDAGFFTEPVTREDVLRGLKGVADPPEILFLPYNSWAELDL